MFGTAYLLRPLLPRLRNLIKDLPVGLSADAKGSLLSAAALGFFSYGMQARDTRSLHEAIAASRLALGEWVREHEAVQWAETQINLGLALTWVGRLEHVTEPVEGAVAAFRAALEELSRVRMPLGWALAQMDLGLALMTLGQLGNATEPLEQAVAAFRAALEELPRDRQPIERAKMQINLGLALMSVGERGSGTVQLNEAVAAYDEALALLVSAKEDDLAKIRSLRDNALALLAKRKE